SRSYSLRKPPLNNLLCRLLSSLHSPPTQPSASPPPPPPNPIEFPLSHPIYIIWGSNTGVGKTLLSAGLASSVLTSSPPPSPSPPIPAKFLYIKPVQTGFPSNSDSRFVYRKVFDIFRRCRPPATLLGSNHALKASISASKEVQGSSVFENESGGYGGLRDLNLYEEMGLVGREVAASGVQVKRELICKTLCAWREAVSPHLAAEKENGVVEDAVMVDLVQRCLWMGLNGGVDNEKVDIWSLLETAGGVASPGPSGTLQCDLYRYIYSL
ncbi:hypothetical protein Dimus_001074, partial [Dionaea muscipula]